MLLGYDILLFVYQNLINVNLTWNVIIYKLYVLLLFRKKYKGEIEGKYVGK